MDWTIHHAVEVTTEVAWSDTDWGKAAAHHAGVFEQHVGSRRRLGSINTQDLDGFVASLASRGLTSSTINRYLAVVSKIYGVAMDRGGCTGMPRMPRQRENRGRIRYLTDTEEQQMDTLLRQAGDDVAADLVTWLIDTGMRVSEALRITPQDIEGTTVSIWCTKNGEARSVPMTSRVQRIAAARSRGNTDPLFDMSRFDLNRSWDRARKDMGLAGDKGFVPHALRHSTASRLVQRGINLAVVQRWLGHKSITVTMRYAHLQPRDLEQAAAALEASA